MSKKNNLKTMLGDNPKETALPVLEGLMNYGRGYDKGYNRGYITGIVCTLVALAAGTGVGLGYLFIKAAVEKEEQELEDKEEKLEFEDF